MIERRGLRAGLAGGAVLCATSAGHADLSWVVFSVYAQNEQGSGQLQLTLSDGLYDPIAGTYSWSGGGLSIRDAVTQQVIATLDTGEVSYSGSMNAAGGEAGINLNFAVQAGFSDTSFTISSGLYDPALQDPAARTSASISMTDTNGDGGALAGNFNDHAYRVEHSGGQVFAELLPSMVVGPGGSTSAADAFPGEGSFLSIGEGINSQFGFTLSALDVASGTSTVQVIPAPAGVALLAGFGVLARRRRRA